MTDDCVKALELADRLEQFAPYCLVQSETDRHLEMAALLRRLVKACGGSNAKD